MACNDWQYFQLVKGYFRVQRPIIIGLLGIPGEPWFGGEWDLDLVTTYCWAYNLTCRLSSWPYIGYPNQKQGYKPSYERPGKPSMRKVPSFKHGPLIWALTLFFLVYGGFKL